MDSHIDLFGVDTYFKSETKLRPDHVDREGGFNYRLDSRRNNLIHAPEDSCEFRISVSSYVRCESNTRDSLQEMYENKLIDAARCLAILKECIKIFDMPDAIEIELNPRKYSNSPEDLNLRAKQIQIYRENIAEIFADALDVMGLELEGKQNVQDNNLAMDARNLVRDYGQRFSNNRDSIKNSEPLLRPLVKVKFVKPDMSEEGFLNFLKAITGVEDIEIITALLK